METRHDITPSLIPPSSSAVSRDRGTIDGNNTHPVHNHVLLPPLRMPDTEPKRGRTSIACHAASEADSTRRHRAPLKRADDVTRPATHPHPKDHDKLEVTTLRSHGVPRECSRAGDRELDASIADYDRHTASKTREVCYTSVHDHASPKYAEAKYSTSRVAIYCNSHHIMHRSCSHEENPSEHDSTSFRVEIPFSEASSRYGQHTAYYFYTPLQLESHCSTSPLIARLCNSYVRAEASHPGTHGSGHEYGSVSRNQQKEPSTQVHHYWQGQARNDGKLDVMIQQESQPDLANSTFQKQPSLSRNAIHQVPSDSDGYRDVNTRTNLETKIGEDYDREGASSSVSDVHKASALKESAAWTARTVTTRRRRLQWTAELHGLFVKAVDEIGLEAAMPKGILQHMGVSGLTRDNVASHLQKYRLAIRRTARTLNEDEYTMATPTPYTKESGKAGTTRERVRPKRGNNNDAETEDDDICGPPVKKRAVSEDQSPIPLARNGSEPIVSASERVNAESE